MREPINTTELVEGLRALADELESGCRPTPMPGQGIQRLRGGCAIVPVVVHDALCGWRVASPQDESEPPVLACAGCGLGYLQSEARGKRG